ncbi:MAG: S26 family signal peptidase [Thermoanaerobaculia bacterium]|nr:S26 family signal peptidase [Thermoanaerobaculia bacterium]
MIRLKTRAPLVAVGVFLVIYVVPQVVGPRTTTAPSLPRGLSRAGGGRARPGASAAVCLPPAVSRFGMARHYLGAGSCPDGAEPVVKVVAAVGGDVVEVTPEAVLVNGVALPTSRPLERDRGGRELVPYARGPQRLELGEVWLHSPYEERSWDSRYFGPVGVECVTTLVEPVLTFR